MEEALFAFLEKHGNRGFTSAFVFAEECGVSRKEAVLFFMSLVDKGLATDSSTKSTKDGDIQIHVKNVAYTVLQP